MGVQALLLSLEVSEEDSNVIVLLFVVFPFGCYSLALFPRVFPPLLSLHFFGLQTLISLFLGDHFVGGVGCFNFGPFGCGH